MRAQYIANTEGVVALATAGTAKTIFGVKGDSGHAIDLLSWGFSFDGTVASEKPVLVELNGITWATNPPGTNSTAVAVTPWAGPRIAETFAAAKNWTTEPTAYTNLLLHPVDYDPYKLVYERDWPLGDTPDSAPAEGFAVRMTIPSGGAAVNARVWMRWARA